MPTVEPKTTAAGRRQACTRCGSRNVARISYGYPMFSDGLQERLDAGEVQLGGCVVWPNQPTLACNACGLAMLSDGRPAPESDELA